MKVLITGVSGLVGRELKIVLTEKNINWIGTFNSNPVDNAYKVNFLDYEEVLKFFELNKPNVCVNCIAERNVDLCENNWKHTKEANIRSVENIAKVCNKLNIYLIHISTDYVFDGVIQPNVPNSQVNPLQNYGISKLLAEYRIKSICKGNNITVRVPVLYTDNVKRLDETAIGLIIKKVINMVDVGSEDNYNIRRPLFIRDLSYFIYDLINTPQTGIVHFYNPYDMLTKFKIAEMISSYIQKPLLIKPIIPVLNSERPYDTQLIDTSYDINKYNITTMKDAIPKCLKSLYHTPISFDKSPKESIFLLIDLDGTLIDTDNLHFEAYKTACNEFSISLTYEEYINTNSINDLIKMKSDKFNKIKKRKIEILKDTDTIHFINGAEELINWINMFNINHAVVTNTGSATVDFFKSKLPHLNLLKNWVTREDTEFAKPDPEPYLKAIAKYYSNEKYKIGIENSITGLESLKHVTKCVYIITNKEHIHYDQFKKEDVYLIPNLSYLNNNVPR
jgi:dTDP-4-dehydrorhamnose reductase